MVRTSPQSEVTHPRKPRQFRPLPDDDEAYIFRDEAYEYGFPKPATFSKWASRPSDAPCELEYFLVGRKAAMKVGVLRRLREAVTFRNSAERTVATERRRAQRDLEVNHPAESPRDERSDRQAPPMKACASERLRTSTADNDDAVG